jgi:hypothetical protein
MSTQLADDIETVITSLKAAREALGTLHPDGPLFKRLEYLTSGADMEALVVDLMGERQVLRELLAQCRQLIEGMWHDSECSAEAERLYRLNISIAAALHVRATPVEVRVAQARQQRLQMQQGAQT